MSLKSPGLSQKNKVSFIDSEISSPSHLKSPEKHIFSRVASLPVITNDPEITRKFNLLLQNHQSRVSQDSIKRSNSHLKEEDIAVMKVLDKTRKRLKIKHESSLEKFNQKYKSVWQKVHTYVDTEKFFPEINKLNDLTPLMKHKAITNLTSINEFGSSKFIPRFKELTGKDKIIEIKSKLNQIYTKEAHQKKTGFIKDIINHLKVDIENQPITMREDEEFYYDSWKKLWEVLNQKTENKIADIKGKYDPDQDEEMVELKAKIEKLKDRADVNNQIDKEEYSKQFKMQAETIVRMIKNVSKNIYANKINSKGKKPKVVQYLEKYKQQKEQSLKLFLTSKDSQTPLDLRSTVVTYSNPSSKRRTFNLSTKRKSLDQTLIDQKFRHLVEDIDQFQEQKLIIGADNMFDLSHNLLKNINQPKALKSLMISPEDINYQNTMSARPAAKQTKKPLNSINRKLLGLIYAKEKEGKQIFAINDVSTNRKKKIGQMEI